jgi:hypothetical protein
MKMLIIKTIAITIIFMISQSSYADCDEDFYGIIESRPEGKAGIWVIGGREINVTENTEFDEDHGPFVVGACVEVEFEDGVVDELETEKSHKCNKQ